MRGARIRAWRALRHCVVATLGAAAACLFLTVCRAASGERAPGAIEQAGLMVLAGAAAGVLGATGRAWQPLWRAAAALALTGALELGAVHARQVAVLGDLRATWSWWGRVLEHLGPGWIVRTHLTISLTLGACVLALAWTGRTRVDLPVQTALVGLVAGGTQVLLGGFADRPLFGYTLLVPALLPALTRLAALQAGPRRAPPRPAPCGADAGAPAGAR